MYSTSPPAASKMAERSVQAERRRGYVRDAAGGEGKGGRGRESWLDMQMRGVGVPGTYLAYFVGEESKTNNKEKLGY